MGAPKSTTLPFQLVRAISGLWTLWLKVMVLARLD
jgi:hypothetical protein